MKIGKNVFMLYDKQTLEMIVAIDMDSPETDADELYTSTCTANRYDLDKTSFVLVSKVDWDQYIEDINFKDLHIDPVEKKAKFSLKQNCIHNTTYNLQAFKRNFSLEDIDRMYNEHYINFNLKNFIKADNFKCRFRYLRDINLRTHTFNKNWNYFHSDPFLQEVHENKLDLGKKILENGTYWPIVISPIHEEKPEKMYVFEGGHRVTSLKLLQLEGLVPEDFKILCLEFPNHYENLVVEQKFRPLKTPYRNRNLLEILYGCEILSSEVQYQRVLDLINNSTDYLVDDYTLETTAKTVDDMITSTQCYPHYLRDLIYNVQDKIKPNPIINDEKLFTEWINT